MTQWLRLRAPDTGGQGTIPVRERGPAWHSPPRRPPKKVDLWKRGTVLSDQTRLFPWPVSHSGLGTSSVHCLALISSF